MPTGVKRLVYGGKRNSSSYFNNKGTPFGMINLVKKDTTKDRNLPMS
jgi:hypothetical protein